MLGLALLVTGLLVSARWRTPWEDEGWYLTVGRASLEGQVVFRDFAFMQMPGLAWFSALVQAFGADTLFLARVGWSLAGLLAAILAAGIAAGWTGSTGASRALWLLACSPAFVVLSATTASWAPSALAAVVPFFVLSRWGVGPKSAFAVGFFSALALFTRLSLAPIPLACALIVVLGRGSLRAFLTGTLLASGLGLLPALLNPLGFLYGVFAFHSSSKVPGLWAARVVLNLLRSVACFGPLLTGLWLAMLQSPSIPFRQSLSSFMPDATPLERVRAALPPVMLAGLGAVVALHLLPLTTLPGYHVILIPLAVALVAGVAPLSRASFGALLLANLAAQGALVVADEHIGPRINPLSVTWVDGLQATGQAVSLLQQAAPGPGPVATLNAELAWRAGKPIFPGLEMGAFSLQGDLDEEACRQLHVLSPALLEADIRRLRPQAVALSTFDIRLHHLEALVAALPEMGYTVVGRVAEYGQYRSTLVVWAQGQVPSR